MDSRILPIVFVIFHLIAYGTAQENGGIDDFIQPVFNPNKTVEPVTGEVVVKNPNNVNVQQNNTGTSGGCTCVPHYFCNRRTETGIDLIVEDHPCTGNYLEICCEKQDIVLKPKPTPSSMQRSGCGYHNPDGVGFRITANKDHESQFGEFPWMVAILQEEAVEGNPKNLSVYQCGGALIHPQVVITAAHCINGKNKRFKVRAGEWDTQTTQELLPHQDREVELIVIHSQFNKSALYNDIALLFLQTPVIIAENVDVICLPPQKTIIDNARCYVSGWGKDQFGKEGRYQVILKKIDLPIVNRNMCQDQLRTTRLGKFFELHNSFICAGGEKGKDTCKGDGGSPLVCPIPGKPGRYQHAGIVSWSIGCGGTQIPSVYVDVAMFSNWIDEQLAYKNLETGAYRY